MRIDCDASINIETFKLPRLALELSKAAFLVATGLVEKNALGRFGDFKAPI